MEKTVCRHAGGATAAVFRHQLFSKTRGAVLCYHTFWNVLLSLKQFPLSQSYKILVFTFWKWRLMVCRIFSPVCFIAAQAAVEGESCGWEINLYFTFQCIVLDSSLLLFWYALCSTNSPTLLFVCLYTCFWWLWILTTQSFFWKNKKQNKFITQHHNTANHPLNHFFLK